MPPGPMAGRPAPQGDLAGRCTHSTEVQILVFVPDVIVTACPGWDPQPVVDRDAEGRG